MSARRYDVTIEQGATWITTVRLKDNSGAWRNLSGYSAGMMIRPSLDSRATGSVLQHLTTENGQIIIGDSVGTLYLTLPDTATATLGNKYISNAVYDLELYGPTQYTGSALLPTMGSERVLYGTVFISQEVTS